MEIRRDEFPVALQAFEIRDQNNEEFIAEQVVSSQAEADGFMARFAGKLIKARHISEVETKTVVDSHHGRTRRGIPGWAILLIVLVILATIAYATGWLQTWIDQAR